ncbi:MAG TPA: hypothetical protein VK003_16980 [Oceanobacillus sp.]|nr:hypothetical protein [Oceanobacillus sp.]
MREVAVFVFPTRGQLVEAAEVIRETPHVKIHHSAVIAKAENGETVILEDDINPDEGAIAGGTLGSVMGALGIAQLGAFLLPGIGPIVAIGAGALIGGLIGGATGSLTAGAIDLGISNQLLDDLAKQLEEDRVAVVVEIEGTPEGLAQLEGQLKPFDAVMVKHNEG